MGGMGGMGSIGLAWFRWQVLRLQRRWGWPLWFGLAVGVLAATLGYLAWQMDVEAKRLGAFRNGTARVEPPRPTKPVTESELKTYYAALPHEEERFALVKRVLLAAEKHGVLPQQADYKLEAEAQTKVVRYQMSLPLKGDFGKIQAFLVDVLNDNRSVAIDSLNVKRESVERGDVEARVQFSVLMVQL
jgi:hypothetical protein